MKILEIAKIIEAISPLELQEEWDNSGFQICFQQREINKVLVALEISPEVVQEALDNDVDMIVTHHPLFFEPIKAMIDTKPEDRNIMKLLKYQVSVYSSHTPFDKCDGGNNDYLAKLLMLVGTKVMEADQSGFCRVGTTDREYSIEEYVGIIGENLGLDKGLMSFAGERNQTVRKVGLCTGAGAEFLEAAHEEACDLFITGDVKYHQGRKARDLGINVLDIGHYGSEKIFVKNMANYLANNTNLQVLESGCDINPFVVL